MVDETTLTMALAAEQASDPTFLLGVLEEIGQVALEQTARADAAEVARDAALGLVAELRERLRDLGNRTHRCRCPSCKPKWAAIEAALAATGARG